MKIYYTPQHIIDYIYGKIANPSAGSGAFLKKAADKIKSGKFDIVKNPPYSKGKK
jgi:hypothetical protein